MLRAIITTAILAFSATLCAQAYKDSVKAQFLRYTDLLTRKEFAKSTEYINPGFFQLVPKPQLIAIIESTYNNPSLDFAIETPVIISIGDVNVVNGHHFLKMQYSNFLTMRFKAVNGRVPDTAATRKSLINRFGQNNVSYDTATGAYKIFVVKDVIANSADKQTWTFVVVEEKQKPLLEKFIPKELLTKGKDITGRYFRIARYTEIWVYEYERWQLLASHSSLLPDSVKHTETRTP